MKVLTTTGLTKLIELSKNTFLDKDNVIDVSDALATVAVTGSYNDLTNKPTIDDLTTSTQQAALNSGATSTNITQITTNKNNITTINNKIPAAATSSNQLADKAFVNSSINAVAAYYVTSDTAGDAFATKAALDTGPYYHDGATRTPTENDYAIVAADETKNNACTRYTYTGSQWSFQYVVNDTPFTQAQINAINSGITSTKVSNYDIHIADTDIHVTTTDKSNWNAKQAAITGAASTVTSSNLTASRVLISNSSGKIAADSNVTTTELGYLDGVTSSIQTQIDGKVSKSGDSMTNNLEMTNGSIYLEGIGGDVASSTSRLNLGSPSNIYAYLTGNSQGAFGIYSERSGTRKGIACYPNQNFFADASTKTIDLGRSNNVWRTGYIDTLSNGASSITIANIIAKQDALVSGTNIKTINNNSILGSGNLTIDSLPAQSGKSGKYLTTNGTSASWADVPTEIPTQTGNNGKFLTTNGSAVSWATVDALPSQTGQSGKYLTTNGSAASWASIPTYTNGAGISLSNNAFSADCDTTTVSTNSSNKLQAIGVVDKRASGAIYTWKGTLAQYNALTTKNDNWLYYITDEGTPSSADYYTKAQIDAMMIANHTITQDTAKVILKDTNTNANAAATPSTNHNGGLVEFQDKNGVKSGYLYTAYKSNGNIEQVLESDRTISGTATSAAIKVGITSTGTVYTEAPMPAASTSIADTNIATVGWINDPTKSTGLVHIAGTETITGAKTFSGNNIFSGTDTFSGSTQFTGNPAFIGGANDAFTVKNSLDDHMLAPAETLSTNIELKDANGNKVGGWEHYHQADGTCITQMVVREQGEENEAFVRVSIDGSGNARCDLPAETYGTNFHGISTRALWADLAEKYRSDKVYPIGTLIRFGGEKDITAATINCNGVISDKPGYVLDDELEDGQPVALVGKTPIRILGKVKRFDRIVLDPEHPGVGKVQVTSDEKVIGIALENNINELEKLVLCVTKFNLD